MEWITAKYSKSVVSKNIGISKLYPVMMSGVYNVFRMEQGGTLVVIFSDQRELLGYVMDNPNALFMLGFLKKSNNKHTYSIRIGGEYVQVYTVSRAKAIMDKTGEVLVFNGGITISELEE